MDYLYKYGENLKHYDVNSLYPKAMCNPMPIEFLGESEGTNVKLKDIFGFAEAKITVPDNINIPLCPFKVDNETIHPVGSWIGIYFTEELKAVENSGYKVELIKVYNFSKADIFTKYIEYFYTNMDSIFIDGQLPKQFIRDNLGLMKDELEERQFKKLIF